MAGETFSRMPGEFELYANTCLVNGDLQCVLIKTRLSRNGAFVLHIFPVVISYNPIVSYMLLRNNLLYVYTRCSNRYE